MSICAANLHFRGRRANVHNPLAMKAGVKSWIKASLNRRNRRSFSEARLAAEAMFDIAFIPVEDVIEMPEVVDFGDYTAVAVGETVMAAVCDSPIRPNHKAPLITYKKVPKWKSATL